MEPLFLKSETALLSYIKKFLKEKPGAVQLDGSETHRPNPKVVVIFRYTVDGSKYKLLGELTRKAAEHFVQLADDHGGPGAVLKEYDAGHRSGLILAHSNAPDGWACLAFKEKSSDRLKKAA